MPLICCRRFHRIHRADSGHEGGSEGEGFPRFWTPRSAFTFTLIDPRNPVMVRRRWRSRNKAVNFPLNPSSTDSIVANGTWTARYAGAPRPHGGRRRAPAGEKRS